MPLFHPACTAGHKQPLRWGDLLRRRWHLEFPCTRCDQPVRLLGEWPPPKGSPQQPVRPYEVVFIACLDDDAPSGDPWIGDGYLPAVIVCEAPPGSRQYTLWPRYWIRPENAVAGRAPKFGQDGPHLTLEEWNYLMAKVSDKVYLSELQTAFGKETPLTEITAARISRWKNDKLAATCQRTGRQYSAAAINRPLAALRHLLQLAHEQQWAALPSVPKIRFELEPEGRIRYLEAAEEARLLTVCGASRAKHLAAIVTVALESGLRKSELLGLTWDRVDLSRGVLRLEITKSGKRREVPMRQPVYDVLASIPEPRAGRVWKQKSIRTAFENAVTGAEIDDFHFHDTRHHFASWFVMRGGSLPALQKILGHADIKMTLRYAHLAPAFLRDEVAKTERPVQEAASVRQPPAAVGV